MRNDHVISTKTEPIFNNYDLFQGPFQYSPFTIGHPDQPEDDHSVRDPTVKTIEKSKFSLSPMHTNQEVLFFKVFKISNDKLSCNFEESSFQLFSSARHNTLTKVLSQTKPIKLKQKFIDVLSKTIKTNYRIMKFKHLFDLDQLGFQRQCIILYENSRCSTSKLCNFKNLEHILLSLAICIFACNSYQREISSSGISNIENSRLLLKSVQRRGYQGRN
ncbi:unnamed protein product (macronuclear) [Paramecium tetraurelia]|uniref:Uncharacterized protein n=1 Tax=Paramecium tetraurelia TaxID=5888 RepID=A0DRA2_PARTE|nr:uncharacterized protein GSPATT00019286001 [Paramecium tetraurelia]CAK85569.1 unnamed protein product [Paramecium tetraurelia]|eukprot:XP_001452966.1 hypothetical protein (macronuclear) [Paramecium tetraurelia strain d4-2]